MRLIDADDTLDTIEKYCGDYFNHDDQSFDKNAVRITIKMAETIDPIHAAGAVYCKECKYCEQHCDEQTSEISYKCTKYSFYDFSDRKPNDFCSHGMLKLPLQEEISAWLTERTFFADSISQTEFIMQQIYFDDPKYEGKQEDQKEIANNCRTVSDAYYYIQTHELNINKIYQRK